MWKVVAFPSRSCPLLCAYKSRTARTARTHVHTYTYRPCNHSHIDLMISLDSPPFSSLSTPLPLRSIPRIRTEADVVGRLFTSLRCPYVSAHVLHSLHSLAVFTASLNINPTFHSQLHPRPSLRPRVATHVLISDTTHALKCVNTMPLPLSVPRHLPPQAVQRGNGQRY